MIRPPFSFYLHGYNFTEVNSAFQALPTVNSERPNISDNAVVQKIRDQIVAKQVELVGLEQCYTDKHPDVQKAKSELQQLQGSLNAEVVASVDSNVATLNPRQSELLKSHALAAVKASVAEAEASKLKELRSKKKKYWGYAQRCFGIYGT